MLLLRTIISSALFICLGIGVSFARCQNETYTETRELLLRLERRSGNKALKKLFEEGDERMADLARALYDPERKVNLNSQVIIKYLATPKGLAALEEWYTHRKTQGKDYWFPPIELRSEDRILDGKDDDPAKLVLMNLHPSKDGDSYAKIIAYNKTLDTVLIEVIYGEIFTEGWHVVLRRENGKWRVVSNNLVWQH
jgi:hypothetical protein